MSVVSTTPVEKFTDEILAKNFVTIANTMDGFDNWISHIEGHVAELSKTVQTLVAKQPKVSKVKPFLLGVATVVVAAKLIERNRHQIEKAVAKAQEAARDAKAKVADN